MAPFDLSSLRRLDQAHHLHPFTDHRAMHREGTHIVRSAKGCTLTFEDGRELLDGLAGLWCVNVGYGREEIAEAVAEQMRAVAFYPSFFNTTTEPTIRLAARLAALAPARLNHSLFSNSGSEANETALKVIRGYWKLRGRREKTKILARTFAYHGVTLATTSLTGLPTCTDPFDLPLPGFLQVPGPHAYGSGKSPTEYGVWCIEETQRVMAREGAGTIAALFVEPVQGAGGVIVPPDGYLRELRELCRRHEILFVADEVITGFGRLGAWFASELWDLDPDLMTMAKGITSGYLPLGGVLISGEIAAPFWAAPGGPVFRHGATYAGHPTCCAAALANLDILESENLIPRGRELEGELMAALSPLADHPACGEIRGGLGLAAAVDLKPELLKESPGALARLTAGSRAAGLLTRIQATGVGIGPPLVIEAAQLHEIAAGIRAGLDAALAG